MLLIILTLTDGSAQQQDSVVTDTVRNKYLPTGVRIGTDAITLFKSGIQDNFNGWEVNGEVDFNRYFLALEYGKWGRNLNSDSASYVNDGRYWRAGIDVNFLKKDPDRNVFFIGGRYGRSIFSERMSLTTYDPFWGGYTNLFQNMNINAWWLELTAGLRVKMWKFLWLGYTGRFKFGLQTDTPAEILPHDVPGFGRTDKETTWGFNYYLMLRIPIRNAPAPVVTKK